MTMPLLIKIKQFCIQSEAVRLILLSILVTYAYHSFFTSHNFGSGPGDAQMYQYQMHDALIQFKHGIFPVYIGQSSFSYSGISFMRSPYYILIGQLLNTITLGQLSALSIQHFTVLISAYGAAFLSYFLFTLLAPNLRWGALVMAYLYVTCPGVIALIYRMDMYFSFMAIPYVPLVVYGLVRSNLKNDNLAYIITATGLSFLWLTHPPIAIWATFVCGLYYFIHFIFLRKNIFSIVIIIALILPLTLWQFTSIYCMGLSKMSNYPGNDNVFWLREVISQYIKNETLGTFLPLGWQTLHTSFLQLGYSLWLILIVGVSLAIRRRNNFLLWCLLTCCVFFFLLLYPFPIVNQFLWSLLPTKILRLNLWPMQRFYIFLATISCFIGVLTLKNIYSLAKRRVRYLVAFILLICCIWNTYQINYFLKTAKASTAINASWATTKNIYFYSYDFVPIYGERDIGANGTFYPKFKSRLLNKYQLPIIGYDNEQILTQQCLKKNIMKETDIKLITPSNRLPIVLTNDPIRSFFNIKKLSSTPYLFFCVEAYMKQGDSLSLEAIGAEYVSYSNTAGYGIHPKKKIVPLLIYHPENEREIYHSRSEGITIYMQGNAKITSYGLVSYAPNTIKLPVDVQSLTPYKAIVETSANNTYLDIGKLYYPGYRAEVNEKNVPVVESSTGTVLVPIKNMGRNKIALSYEGTLSMYISFYISAASWGTLFIYLLFRWYHNRRRT